MNRLIIGSTVGYMLKVLRSGVKISKFDKAFKSIRHGNYYDFINIIREPIPFMITYNQGDIRVETGALVDDIDFAGMLKAEPSLVKFYNECYNYYGEIHDQDIEDEIFYKLIIFELGIRMHASNLLILNKGETLEVAINKLGEYHNLGLDELLILHEGRKFLNMVKHFKQKFASWEIGVNAFKRAYEICEMKNWIII